MLGYTREIASNLTLSPDAAKTEAGVVAQELALRDSPAYRAEQAELDFVLKDPKATQLPSGDPAIIAKADVGELRKFYNEYYRPERATLVIVGDVDPGKIAGEIKADFGDWKGVGPAGQDPNLHIPLTQTREAAKLVVEPGTRSRLSLLWTAAPSPKPDDVAREKAGLVDSIALRILNRRLEEAGAKVSPPFTGASASSDQMFQAVKLTSFSIGFEPGQWQKALDAAEKIRLGILATGATQEEVDRAATEFRTSFQTGVAGAATRPSRRIMSTILSNLSDNDVFTSPERDLQASTDDLKGLTAADVTAALKRLFAGPALVFVTSPKAIDGGEQAILAALDTVDKTPLAELPGAPEAQPQVAAWSYNDFGKPGTVTASHETADLGARSVTFSNGVRLTVRPSKVRANQVLVAVKVGGGRLDLPRDKSTIAWAAGALLDGGLKDISHADMERALAAKTVRTGFGVGEDGYLFTGNTSPADMNTQLQVIGAYLAEPGFRPEGMEQVKTRYEAQLRQSDTSPGGILRMKAPELLHDGDKRWATPSLEDVEAANMEQLKALLEPVFQKGALDVTIVGDVTDQQAIDAVAATLGALPKRTQARASVTKENDTHLPADKVTPIDLSHSRQSDQIITGVVWPTHGEVPDIKDDATLELMSDIMQERLFDKLRGAGVAYTARVGSSASRVFDYGYLQAEAQLSPEKTAQFYGALDTITADLKAGQIAADELERARNPAIQSFEKSKQTNEYWLSVLTAGEDNPRALDMPRQYEAALKDVSLADIQAAAKKYLAEPRMIRLTAGT